MSKILDLSSRTRSRTKRRSQLQQAFTEPESPVESSPGFFKKRKTSGPLAMHKPKCKAVLVGVSEPDPEEDLNPEERSLLVLRAHSDVELVRQFLIDHCGYRSENIVVMMDSDKIPLDCRPTKVNVLKQLDRMLSNPGPGDRYFFYFAGHGLQKECFSGTESDGFDELIECEDGQLIKDNELHDHLVKPLVPGSQLTALVDSCHAGTMLDLPHYSCNKLNKVGLAFIAIFRMQKSVIISSQSATVSPLPSCSFSSFRRPSSPFRRPSLPFHRPSSPLSRPSSPFRSRHRPTISASIPLAITTSIPLAICPVATLSPLSLSGSSISRNALSRAKTAADVTLPIPNPSITRSASIPIRMEIASARAKSSTMMGIPSQATPLAALSMTAPCRHNSINSMTHAHPKGKCDGLCDPPEDADAPRVISLGACADKELSYEKDTNGGLMTAWFLEIMRASPNTTYQDLMIGLRKRCSLEYRQRLKLIGEHEVKVAALLGPGQPMPDFSELKGRQSPQLSSLHPLNMNEVVVI